MGKDLDVVKDISKGAGALRELVELAVKHRRWTVYTLLALDSILAFLSGRGSNSYLCTASIVALLVTLIMAVVAWWCSRKSKGLSEPSTVDVDVIPLRNALRYAAEQFGTVAFDQSENGWGRFITAHSEYYAEHRQPEVAHHLSVGRLTNVLVVLGLWWSESIAQKVTAAAASGRLDDVKGAVAALDQFNDQVHRFYEDIVGRVMAVDPSDDKNLLGSFHRIYGETIEPVEVSVLPIQVRYGLAWKKRGRIAERFKDLRTTHNENVREWLKGRFTGAPEPEGDQHGLSL